ncbi:MAG: DUF6090 family protein [Maribacter sp.]|nr:DUF6090 family protein [Maribacter sp.]
MIKFFRQIRQSLLMENKNGKPALPAGRYLKYAIGEIVLVVIGILIALQINTWNQARINTKEERRIYQDLAEELEFNQFLLDHGRGTMGEVIAVAERLLSRINAPEAPIKEDDFDRDIDKLTWEWVSGRPTTLYDALSGSGDFTLITSPVMRKKLADLKTNQELLIAFEALQHRFVDEQLRPFLNKTVDRTKVRSSLEGAEWNVTRHTSIFPPSKGELLQNREFANLLIDLLFFTERITKTYSRIEQDIDQIDSLIVSKYPDIQAKPYIPY